MIITKRILFLTTLWFICFDVYGGNIWLKIQIEGVSSKKAEIVLAPVNGEKEIFKTKIPINSNDYISVDLDIDRLHQGYLLTKEMYYSGYKKIKTRKLKSVTLFFEPGDTLTIKGKLNEYSVDYQITGNTIVEQHNEWRNRFFDQMERNEKEFFEFLALDKKSKDLIPAMNKYDVYSDNVEKLYAQYLTFIEEHTDYEYSPLLIDASLSPFHEVMALKDKFAPNVLSSEIGKSFKELTVLLEDAYQKQLIKESSIDFVIDSTNMLSDLKGKIVVLDFWGTWCAPCIRDLPKLKEKWIQYEDQVVFIGIACYDTQEKLDRAIVKHSIRWTNVLNTPSNNVKRKYKVNSFPTKFIIDKQGNIIWSSKSGNSLDFYKMLDYVAYKGL